MWTKTYSKKVSGIAAERLWQVWTNIDLWHTWQHHVVYAKLDGKFAAGNYFTLKPKGAPRVRIQLIKVEANRQFVDLTKFPGARMLGNHEFIRHTDGLEIKTTISIEGFLSFIWRKLVAEDVANSLPQQTDHLIEQALLD